MVSGIVADDTANWRGGERNSASAKIEDRSRHIGESIANVVSGSTEQCRHGRVAGFLHLHPIVDRQIPLIE